MPLLLLYHQPSLLWYPGFLLFLLLFVLLPHLPLPPRIHEARQMQLTRPHSYPLLWRRRGYAHSMPRFSLLLHPLLLPLQICFPSRFPLLDPVCALLQHSAPLEHGLFAFRETDCTAGFAVGSFGLFEGLRAVCEGRGRHCRCYRGRSGGAADCRGPCRAFVVLGTAVQLDWV